MHPREKVLEQARLYHLKGEPLPVDLLAHADVLGILISSLAPPPRNKLKADKSKETKLWLKPD